MGPNHKNIMLTVSIECLNFLLSRLVSLLTRGLFQVHVFTKQIYALLDAFKVALKYAMDKCIQCILEMWHSDIFGQSCDGKLDLKAKPHHKIFYSLNIYTVVGLIINKQISIETILMTIYESIRDLVTGIAQLKFCVSEKSKIRQQQSSCFLISNDPVILARGIVSTMLTVTNIRANAHMLIDFGLEMLQLTLKCGKPFVPILNDSIGSCCNVRVTTLALKCISIIISKQMPLERLDAAISIFGNIFFLPMQSVFKTIVNILWINHKKKC